MIKSRFVAGKSNSSRSRLRGAREVVIDGFLLSGGHRSCCAFHCKFVSAIERKKDCREGRAHSELDGAVSLKSVSSSMLCGRRGGVLLSVLL